MSKKKKDDYIIYNVYHEFVGTQTPLEAITPVILEDLRRKRDKYIKERSAENGDNIS